jgi:hypothetical protein
MQSCQTVSVPLTEETVHDWKGLKNCPRHSTLKQACVLYMYDPRVNKFLDGDSTLPSPQHSVIQKVTKCQKQRCVHYCAFLLNLLEDNPGLVNKVTRRDEAYCYSEEEEFLLPVHRKSL